MSASQQSNQSGRVTVVLAPPSSSNAYYASSRNAIVDFMVVYAKKIIEAGRDNVIVLVDKETKKTIGERLPRDVLLEAHVEDIWMRDFSPAGLNSQALFTYRPNYLSANDARLIQRSLTDTVAACGDTNFRGSNLILDGGNVVDNFIDSAIVTDRVLKDNPTMSRASIEQELRLKLNYSRIVIIPSEPDDRTGHSDGMVAFLDKKILAVSPPTTAIEAKLWDSLRQSFGNDTTFISLNSEYKDEVWRGYGSACGLHVNMLATDSALYVPTFGADAENQQRGQSMAKDAEVLGQIRAAIGGINAKKVVEVPVPFAVCRMGGSVRCLSWAAKGPFADRLVESAQTGRC
uniref:Agmatine deiminase n=1 Tax=Plectus sambesii TaxID=2011161 RepID=A0A914XFY3_9BILA